ncbi:MAG: hypothetical protein LBI96_01125 [Odoribacteraceae bacterium]|jgi:hypothetical protein|nr:hypothetical protein [Odoribacteraceae bacterium]
MDYKFEISLPNNPEFRCEIAIGGEQTFQHLHDKLVETLGYDNAQMASFFTIDRLGNRQKEIALMDMTAEDESDTLVMDGTRVSDIVKPGCLELDYVFDFFANRYFRVEYAGEYIRDSSDIMPTCISCSGKIPEQFSYNAEKDDWDFGDSAEEYGDDNYDGNYMDEFGSGGGDYDDDENEDNPKDNYDDEDGEHYESLDDYIDRL